MNIFLKDMLICIVVMTTNLEILGINTESSYKKKFVKIILKRKLQRVIHFLAF